VRAQRTAFRSPFGLIAIAGTAGPLNDRDSRKRRGYHARVWGVGPANIRPGSVHLSQHFPNSHLSGKSHEVILMDDRDHAGFLMAHVVERAANAETLRRFSCMLAAGRRSTFKCRRSERL
jgi:hypothetical protein